MELNVRAPPDWLETLVRNRKRPTHLPEQPSPHNTTFTSLLGIPSPALLMLTTRNASRLPLS